MTKLFFNFFLPALNERRDKKKKSLGEGGGTRNEDADTGRNEKQPDKKKNRVKKAK